MFLFLDREKTFKLPTILGKVEGRSSFHWAAKNVRKNNVSDVSFHIFFTVAISRFLFNRVDRISHLVKR